jgi:hypothetical protein
LVCYPALKFVAESGHIHAKKRLDPKDEEAFLDLMALPLLLPQKGRVL